MKNFGAILMVLATGATFGAALPAQPAPGSIQARVPHDYALHVRYPKKKHNNGNGNANAAANNGTAVAVDVCSPRVSSIFYC